MPRHLSEIVRALGASVRETSEVSISGRVADPHEWLPGTIESSRGDLANSYEVSVADGSAVTARSVLEGTPLEVGRDIWLVRAAGQVLIAGLR